MQINITYEGSSTLILKNNFMDCVVLGYNTAEGGR